MTTKDQTSTKNFKDGYVHTAYHEAAHAVAQVRFNLDNCGVTIVPEDDVLGYAGQLEGYDDVETAENNVICFLAGHIACMCLDPSSEHRSRGGAKDDFAKAGKILNLIENEVDEACWDRWLNKTRDWVTEAANWRAIKEVAAELLEYRILDSEEIERIIEFSDGGEEKVLMDLIRYRVFICAPPRIETPQDVNSSVEGRNYVLRLDEGGLLLEMKK